MNSCLQKYTTHQFAYFIYYLFQDKFQNPKIKILQVHQKIHTKQFFILYKLFSICNSFELKVTREVRLIKSHANSKCSVRYILKATTRSLESVALSIFYKINSLSLFELSLLIAECVSCT